MRSSSKATASFLACLSRNAAYLRQLDSMGEQERRDARFAFTLADLVFPSVEAMLAVVVGVFCTLDFRLSSPRSKTSVAGHTPIGPGFAASIRFTGAKT